MGVDGEDGPGEAPNGAVGETAGPEAGAAGPAGGHSRKILLGRIKRMMQADENVGKIAATTPIMLSKMLELFLKGIVTSAAAEAQRRGARALAAGHVKFVVQGESTLDFLREIVASAADAPEHEEPPAPAKAPRARSRRKKEDGKGAAAAGGGRGGRGGGRGSFKKRGASGTGEDVDWDGGGSGSDGEAPAVRQRGGSKAKRGAGGPATGRARGAAAAALSSGAFVPLQLSAAPPAESLGAGFTTGAVGPALDENYDD